jgi:glutamate/tyrosine decarboxylase-like PLP-dependent enzyme
VSSDPAEEGLGQRDSLVASAAERARSYLGTLAERRVSPSPEAIDALAGFPRDLPAEPIAAHEVLALLDGIGSPATTATAGPRYFGFVNGGTLPIALATSWLSAAWDQNVALAVMSPVAAHLEELALKWIAELIGLPEGSGGGFVGGATLANTTCLIAARDAVLARHGWDATEDGLFGAPPIDVYVGAEAHSALHKSLGLVGLGRARVHTLPADSQGRIIASGLPRIGNPAILCTQAGNVNGGASDPFGPLIDWAHAGEAWVHVDGAFGLWAAASPAVADHVDGVQGADSWATDAHKWLNTTYDSGIALVRDAELLRRSMSSSAAYLMPGEVRDPMSYTPSASQRARGVECWAVLAHLGRRGVAELVEGSCALARRFSTALSAAGAEVLNDVVLNQVVVAFGDAGQTDAVIERVQADGTCWAGSTTWQGRRAMRISISCWATTEHDVDRSTEAIIAAARAQYP